MTMVISGSDGVTFPDSTNQFSGGAFSFKNRIINGAMVIDQRNAGASVTPTSSSYTLDRWQAVLSQASKYSVQQNAGSVTPPAGYSNYLGVTSLSAYSVGANDFFCLTHYIEGFNAADLGFGAAGAQTVTLSFWVRSSLTGTFGGSLQNSAQNRCYPFSYTISVANTWEQKTVTISGDTTGTWLSTNGRGVGLVLGLGVGSTYGSGTAGAWVGSQVFVPSGSTSVVGTNGATFYITGVQLEVGSVATPFERRPYGAELALCQRYYWQIGSGASKVLGLGFYYGASEIDMTVTMPVSMRSTATIVQSTGTNYFSYNRTSDTFDSWGGSQFATDNTINLFVTSGVSGTTGLASYIITNNASASLALSAEL